ncbi:tetratricopeptide repeat protein [Dysosmobacter sp.]
MGILKTKAKRIWALLLVLVMVCTMLPMTASAAGSIKIEKIEITGLPEPVAGAKNTTKGISVPANAGYSIDNYATGWLWDENNTGIRNHWFVGTYEAGVTYRFNGNLLFSPGYYIDNTTTATINGKPATLSLIDECVYLDFTVPGKNCTVSFDAQMQDYAAVYAVNALFLNPFEAHYYYNAALTGFGAGRQDAIPILYEGMLMFPDDASLNLLAGLLARSNGDTEMAAKYFDTAIANGTEEIQAQASEYKAGM